LPGSRIPLFLATLRSSIPEPPFHKSLPSYITVMDTLAAEDEKKPFDAVALQNDDDTQPDPDEQLMYQEGPLGRIWLAKVMYIL
jgi:hypothetical protein